MVIVSSCLRPAAVVTRVSTAVARTATAGRLRWASTTATTLATSISSVVIGTRATTAEAMGSPSALLQNKRSAFD